MEDTTKTAPNDNGQNDANVEDRTQPEVVVTSADDNKLKGDSGDSIVTIDDGTPTGEQSEQEPQKSASLLENELNSIRGKISKLEKENQELKTTPSYTDNSRPRFRASADQLAQLNNQFTHNKPGYEQWRQNLVSNGYQDPGSYEDIYVNKTSSGNIEVAQTQSNTYNAVQPPVDVNQIVQQVKSETVMQVERDMKFKDGISQLFTEHPDLNIDKYEEGTDQHDKVKNELMAIAQIAGTYKQLNPSLSEGDAMLRAKQAIDLDKQVESARQEGELVGYAKANAVNSGATGTVTGSQSRSQGRINVRMNKAQKATYDRLMSQGKTGPARKFAERIAQRQNG